MSIKTLIKKLIKSIVRRVFTFSGSLISRIEYKEWYEFPRDGVYTIHSTALINNSSFARSVDAVLENQSFGNKGKTQEQKLPLYRLYILWGLVRSIGNVPGDIVEFGTYKGGCAHFMLNASSSFKSKKNIYLYDTFAGIPDICLTENEKISLFSGRFNNTSIDLVKKLLSDYIERVHFFPGVIPDSLGENGPKSISFMHVDLNAAKPTVDALEWAYPKWTKHGICLLDDYLDKNYSEQRKLVEIFFSEKNHEIVGLPTGQGFVINN